MKRLIAMLALVVGLSGCASLTRLRCHGELQPINPSVPSAPASTEKPNASGS